MLVISVEGIYEIDRDSSQRDARTILAAARRTDRTDRTDDERHRRAGQQR